MVVLSGRTENNEIIASAFPSPNRTETFFYQLDERFGDEGYKKRLSEMITVVFGRETKTNPGDRSLSVAVMPSMATPDL
jgi:hypothetical protein